MKDICQVTFTDLDIICYVCKASIEKINWLAYEESVSWRLRRHRRKRMDWFSSRIAAKTAAIQWLERNYQLQLDPELITISNTDSGIPHLKWPLEISTPNLSISHKDHIGLASVSDIHIVQGCDIEIIKERHSEFSTHFLTCDEKKLWFKNEIKVNSEIVERKFIDTMLWSAKESIIKAIISTDTSKKSINMVHIFLKPFTKNHNNSFHFSFSYKNYKGIGKWMFIKGYVISISLLNSNYYAGE